MSNQYQGPPPTYHSPGNGMPPNNGSYPPPTGNSYQLSNLPPPSRADNNTSTPIPAPQPIYNPYARPRQHSLPPQHSAVPGSIAPGPVIRSPRLYNQSPVLDARSQVQDTGHGSMVKDLKEIRSEFGHPSSLGHIPSMPPPSQSPPVADPTKQQYGGYLALYSQPQFQSQPFGTSGPYQNSMPYAPPPSSAAMPDPQKRSAPPQQPYTGPHLNDPVGSQVLQPPQQNFYCQGDPSKQPQAPPTSAPFLAPPSGRGHGDSPFMTNTQQGPTGGAGASGWN